ncbi:MAG: cyanophycinase [Rhodoferax sp.]|jgi:cyanophycinase
MATYNLNRRHLLALGAAATLPAAALAQTRRAGRLVVIGGAEDRLQDRVILERFLALCGGVNANIVILAAASIDPAAAWLSYQRVFQAMGATQLSPLLLDTAGAANTPESVNQILSADGIFMTGGDQRRLMARLLETETARAMHTAFHLRGCCIGGTSAGAAVMSQDMLAEGFTPQLPEKDAAMLDHGLGFVPGAIIDQHFSERRRLGRLLSVLAERPDRLGVGIDEDTALVIERRQGIEVIGQGVVTLIDGRRMQSNIKQIASRDQLELLGVTMHVLPAGNRYLLTAPQSGKSRALPASLRDAIGLLVAPGPVRG